jgi:tRNA(Ile)-lysidine synthase
LKLILFSLSNTLPEIESKVLPLTMKGPPNVRTNIESVARTERYQILGRACKRLKTTNLLVAHHQDDQLETVLARLATSHSIALSAMRSSSKIPECFGLHGVNESGSYCPLLPSQLPPFCGIRGIEHGGVQVLRPLLDFSKKRLIATCEKFGVQWFEDETNKDKTLTGRNALRYILHNHRLPEALSYESIIQLRKRKLQFVRTTTDLANILFNQMSLKLDIRAGVATVVFPKLNHLVEGTSRNISVPGLTDPAHINLVAQTLIRRVASLVSPAKKLQVGNFYAAVGHIFDMAPSDHEAVMPFHPVVDKRQVSPRSFVAGRVLFERLDGNSTNSSTTPSMMWRLSRATAVQSPLLGTSRKSLNLCYPPQNAQCKVEEEESFTLWDGRFWISVHNPSAHDFWVRPLKETDLASLHSLLAEQKVVLRSIDGLSVTHGNHKVLDKILKEVARDKIRYTLPVIELRDSKTLDSMSEGREEGPSKTMVLAFPTLGLRVERLHDETWPDWAQELKWEVRYKSIDLGTKSLKDCLIGYQSTERSVTTDDESTDDLKIS